MKNCIPPSFEGLQAALRKAPKALILISLSLLLTFNSCRNIFDDSVDGSDQETEKIDEVSSQLPEQIPDQPAAPAAPVVIPKVVFGGELSVKGALPEKMEKALTEPDFNEDVTEGEDSTHRTARPSVPTPGTAYEYYVKASNPDCGTFEAVAQLDANDGKYKYQIALEVEKLWTFEAGFRKKAIGEEGDPDYVAAQPLMIDAETVANNSFSTMLSENMDTTSHDFILKPSQTEGGKGRLDLSMKKMPSNLIQDLKLFVPNQTTGIAEQWLDDSIIEIGLNSTTDEGNYIRSKNDAAGNPVFNIDSGSYDVTLIFYKRNGSGPNAIYPVYISSQTINIFDNMTTDCWINESGSPADAAIKADGSFELSASLMQNFLDTTLYVGAVPGIDVEPSDVTNTGGPYSPFATLRRALSMIEATGNGSAYRIYINGTQTGNFTIHNDYTATGVSPNASSIEISGYLNNQAVLDGNKTGTALTILTSIPVTLKNIKIINGKATTPGTSGRGDKGGGIYMSANANVTLGPGVVVGGAPTGVTGFASGEDTCSNYAIYGGGIYCEGNLTLKKGSEVSYNYASDPQTNPIGIGGGGICCKNGTLKIESGVKVIQNGAYRRGGGIALDGADFLMTGGNVDNNHSYKWGGGIITGNLTLGRGFLISGGSISGNSAEIGGGIYFDNQSNATVNTISGSTLNGNKSVNEGGAIRVVSGVLNLQGGTISNNETVGTEGYSGGAIAVINSAVLKMSGSVKIPYGVANGDSTSTGVGKNDVYLAVQSGTLKTITLESDLSNHTESNKIYLTLGVWERDKTVVTAGSGFTLTDAIKNKFAYTKQGWISKIESNAIKLDSPIYVKNGGSASATGTSADPFDNIQHALSAMVDSNKDYVIYVDGTVNGPQEIPAESMTPAFAAKSITIEGINNGTLDGQNCNASVLDIRATCDVTIRNLTIKGADNINTGSPALGGGIKADTTGKLTLATGTIITENKCGRIGDGIGGGVYKSAGILEIKDGVEISRNTATSGGGIASMSSATIIMSGGTIKGNSVSSYGGGLFLNGGKLFMYGSAVIGTASESLTEYTVDQGCNLAGAWGGGICALSGDVYIGFTGLDSSNNPVLATGEDVLTGGIMGNYAGTEGAGIYSSIDNFIVGDGNISRNKTGENGKGGAIYNSSSSSCTIRGGIISDNIATYGGAIYNGETLKLEGGAKIPGSATAGANDIYLAVNTAPLTQYVVTVCASEFSNHSEATPIYLTLPAWERGTKILEAADTTVNIDSAKNYFNLTDGGWAKSIYDTDSDGTYDTVKITSPLYVAGSDGRVACSAPPASGACGTIAKPYATIVAALAASDLAEAGYTITIDGTVTGAQTISGLASSVSGITLTGYKASGETSSTAKIDAGGTTGAGSALSVNAYGKTVTIKDLTITGGAGSPMTVSGAEQLNGGGICINAGTVKLTDGAVITGNTVANNGGGVYVASGATLFMSGKALIGDSATSTERASSASGYFANKAANGAGIYNDGGAVYIGCDTSGVASTGYALVANSTDGYYGVRRNFTTTGGAGAGIYHAGGTLKIASGDISNNNAGAAQSGVCNGGGIYFFADAIISGGTFTNNFAANGGGLYIASGKSVTINGNAVFTKNKSWVNGGAIYNHGELIMSAGTIGGNETTDVNSATGSAGLDSYGGAIYQNGTFKMSGSAYISSVGSGVKSNDVYLSGDKTITINSATLNGGDTVATITPNTFIRGRQILSLGVTVTESQLNTLKAKFALTETGWDKENIQELSSWTGVKINSPIYVASTATSDTTRIVCKPAVTTGANGTKEKPYATIAAALGASDLSTAGNKITVDGTLGSQSVASTTTLASGVTAITLQGYKTSSTAASSAQINGGGTATALSLAKSGLTTTITDLTIKGGSAANGAGINITAGTVTLGSGAKVTGNTATGAGKGAGVYVAASTRLNITDGAAIYSNGFATTATERLGGGVYNAGTVDMTGGSIYSNTAGDASKSGMGGGVYNAGSLYVSTGSPVIYSNSAQAAGGIYNASSKTLKFGVNASGTTAELSSATSYSTMYGNKALGGTSSGGAVYTGGTFIMKSGVIGKSGSPNTAYAGAGVDIGNSGSFTMEGGKIVYNKASNHGGGIGNSGSLELKTSVEVSNNSATDGHGGAVWTNGSSFKISGTVSMPYGVDGTTGAGKNDVELTKINDTTCKTITVAGSMALADSSKKIYITPWLWKRGMPVLDGDSLNTTNAGYFAVTDTEWSVESYAPTTTTLQGVINAPIYVASTAATDSNRTGGVSQAPATAAGRRGTKAAPYASINEAIGECNWDIATTKTKDFVINVAGNVTVSEDQGFASTITNAKSITIQGVYGNSKDVINRGLTSAPESGGHVLGIWTGVPITIKNLKITGGYEKASGGGIYVYVAKANLTLGSGALITGNKASGNAGGIFFSGTNGNKANLIMLDGSQISANQALGTESLGGGVYLNYANLCMSGSAIIGQTTSYNTAASSSTACSNYAGKDGGGVYAGTGTYLFLGYTQPVTNNAYKVALTGGIIYNYAGGSGGGVACPTDMQFNTGNISKNGCAANGAGIYLNSNSSLVNMTGGTISYNSAAANGGGIYCEGDGTNNPKFKMAGDSTSSEAIVTGNSAVNGGGVYVQKANFCLKGWSVIGAKSSTGVAEIASTNHSNSATTNGGGLYIDSDGTAWIGYSDASSGSTGEVKGNYGVRYNYAANGGGGVCLKGVMYFNSGKIIHNIAKKDGGSTMGGGIYGTGYGKLYMSGTACVGDNTKGSSVFATSDTACANYASKGGGIYTESNACLYLGYKENGVYDDAFVGGGVSYNYASMGGGIYVNGNSWLYMAGGTVQSNGANTMGGGIMNSNAVKFGGIAYVPAGSNDKENGFFENAVTTYGNIYGYDDRVVTKTVVATFSFQAAKYNTSTRVLADNIKDYNARFKVFKDSSNQEWEFDSNGRLKKKN